MAAIQQDTRQWSIEQLRQVEDRLGQARKWAHLSSVERFELGMIASVTFGVRQRLESEEPSR